MKKIGFLVDSNCAISKEEAKALGVHMIPMPFYINEELFYEHETLTHEEFYKKLEEDAVISTSQPSPGDVIDFYDSLLKEYDEILHIPMTASLSSTHDTAVMLAADYDNKVQVVDNRRISVTLKQSLLNAMKLAQEGKSASQIKEILEANRENAQIYIIVDTLKYLKKGGRITPGAAAIGSVLKIKPILALGIDKIDSFAKARGSKQAIKMLIDALENDINGKFSNKKMKLYIAHNTSKELYEKFKADLEEKLPGYEVEVASLSLGISCHVGPGVLAAALAEEL